MYRFTLGGGHGAVSFFSYLILSHLFVIRFWIILRRVYLFTLCFFCFFLYVNTVYGVDINRVVFTCLFPLIKFVYLYVYMYTGISLCIFLGIVHIHLCMGICVVYRVTSFC
ncbi:hypothetical protein FKM82_005216 [Ascaphus truei]